MIIKIKILLRNNEMIDSASFPNWTVSQQRPPTGGKWAPWQEMNDKK